MPDVTLSLKAKEAVQIYQRVASLKHGDKTFKAPRQKFLRAITNAWPEIQSEEPLGEKEGKALDVAPARAVIFTGDQQKAVSEGLLSVMSDPATMDITITQIFREAKLLRLVGRLDKAFMADSCGPMEEALDGEDESVDLDDESPQPLELKAEVEAMA